MLAKRLWLLLFVGIAGFYVWGLGLLPLVGPDEPRYAEAAREMSARHDLITPTLGGLPWFEKPPMLYWLVMASYRVLGVSEYAARIGPALCGLLCALFVYWTVKRCGSPIDTGGETEAQSQRSSEFAKLSVLIFLSSIGVITFARGASFDIVVTMTLTGALACFFVWQVRTACGSGRLILNAKRASQRSLLFAFYLFIGLSLLAKGLIGIVIPFGVIAFYFLLRRERPNRNFVLSILWGIPLALAVAAVWYGPMIQRHGWTFVDQFIIQHHLARFTTNKYHHSEPFYFYLPVLAGLALPWTVFLIAAFVSSRRWAWRGEAPADRLRVFALSWIIVPLIFFSLSQSKLTAYILPVMPAVALLIAERFECFRRADRGRRVMQLTGALMIVLAAGGAWYSFHELNLNRVGPGGAALGLLAVGAIALARPQMRKSLVVLLALATFAASAVAIICAAPLVAQRESVRDLLAMAGARGYATSPVVQLHTTERTAEFYAAGRISYRSDGEPVKLEGVKQVEDAARQSGGTVLCFVPIEYESQLTKSLELQTQVIGNNGRVSLVAVSALK